MHLHFTSHALSGTEQFGIYTVVAMLTSVLGSECQQISSDLISYQFKVAVIKPKAEVEITVERNELAAQFQRLPPSILPDID